MGGPAWRIAVGSVLGLLGWLSGCGGESSSDSPAGCPELCANLASAECGPFNVEQCELQCEKLASSFDECELAVRRAVACGARAPVECRAVQCYPGPCPEEPRIAGCEAQSQALDECDSGCPGSGGGGISETPDGRTVNYSYLSECGECPPALLGAAPGEPCTSGSECASICCDCNGQGVRAEVCIDGVCATEGEACSADVPVCTYFG